MSYSATIRLELVVEGVPLPLTHTCSDWVILEGEQRVMPGFAQLVMTVDDAVQRREVEILPHREGTTQVPIRFVN